ncbi:MAG: hypothetical protein M0Z46_11955 [Actinomycetota bacterium]|jgi:hypothetical protein|nr:hypothetical protein [Actinomycetota bacterium]
MASSVGKRQREQHKLEQAKAKAERKAARRAVGSQPPVLPVLPPPRSEGELIEDLATLHRALEAGEVPVEEFELRRDRIQAQLEQLSS